MLVNNQRTQNFNAVSAVNVVEGSATPVAYFNGSINNNGEVITNMQIRDMKLFEENKETVLADRDAFDEEVYSYVNKIE